VGLSFAKKIFYRGDRGGRGEESGTSGELEDMATEVAMPVRHW